jgi:hypothetical protein
MPLTIMTARFCASWALATTCSTCERAVSYATANRPVRFASSETRLLTNRFVGSSSAPRVAQV